MAKLSKEERFARRAAAMRFDGMGDLDIASFERDVWQVRAQSLQALNIIAAMILTKSDVGLTEMLADPEMRARAADVMPEFADGAKHLRATADVFDAVSMRLLCACARHEYGLARSGEPIAAAGDV